MTEIETASERGNTSRGSGRGRRLIAEEPDVGLDLTTLGSRPEPQADAQPLCHPGAPGGLFSISRRTHTHISHRPVE